MIPIEGLLSSLFGLFKNTVETELHKRGKHIHDEEKLKRCFISCFSRSDSFSPTSVQNQLISHNISESEDRLARIQEEISRLSTRVQQLEAALERKKNDKSVWFILKRKLNCSVAELASLESHQGILTRHYNKCREEAYDVNVASFQQQIAEHARKRRPCR